MSVTVTGRFKTSKGAEAHDAADLRKAMGTVFNDLKKDQISCDKARALATDGNSLRAVLVDSELESRIKALEEKLDDWIKKPRAPS